MDSNTSAPALPLQSPTPSKKPRPSRQSARLGIKKRKPRSNAVITAANDLARAAAAVSSLPAAPPVAISPPAIPQPHVQQPPPPLSITPQPTTTLSPDNDLTRPPTRVSDSKRKGLRHFAVRVSRKVEQKHVTTYNEVADELVAEERAIRQRELAATGDKALQAQPITVDEKNIRRRVYDSLNVLMAMRIIAKEKKLITWQGLAMAQSSQGDDEITEMKAAIVEKKRLLEEKARTLAEVKEQYRKQSFLVERNRMADEISGMGDDLLALPQSMMPLHQQYPDRIGIPYIIVSAPKETNIELEMDQSREDICFSFNSSFAIFDDREILRRMEIPHYPSSSGYGISEVERLGDHMLDSTTPSGTP